MMNSINYIKQKREKKDYCNICGRLADLTWDHVPPKGITHGGSVIANTAFEGLPEPTAHMKKFQSGIKYRSICQECNNVVLGENDKVFQEFVTDIDKQLHTPLVLRRILVSVKINRLCRAMIGHTLAAKNLYDRVIPDQKMREYVLNPARKLQDLYLYVWLYPYNSIVIARDFVTSGFTKDSHPKGMVSAVIASYPIAYMVCDEPAMCGVDDLSRYTTENLDDLIDVPVSYSSLFIKGTQIYKPFNWPINIGNDQTTSAMFAIGGPVLHEDSRLGLREQ